MDERKSFIMDLAETIDRHWPRRTDREGEPAARPGWLRWLSRQIVPNIGTLLLVAVLILTQQVWAEPLLGTANVPGPSANTVNYQGRLADDAGTPLDGSYGMNFALYDAATDGNLVWGPESHAAVPVSDGLFSVGLGSQTSGGIPTSVWNGDIYLEVTVSGETLEPRELIRSVPIAGMAITVPDGAITGDKLSSTFGSSGQPLLNFIPRPTSSNDLELATGVGWTEWDLSSIVGNSATAVVVYVRVAGSESGAFVGLRGNGTTQRVVMASALHLGEYKGYGELTILCGPDQVIEYRLDDDGSSSVEAQFLIVGWYEPVNTP
jgi:hypothetical protein